MTKPNILFITSDQHRWDCLGVQKHPVVYTPHLDQLAHEGTLFNRAYSDAPICIPARTTMITGIESHHYGCPNYNSGYRIQRDRQDFLGSLMTSAGYQTCLVGKTHWHTPERFRAGFEHVEWLAKMRVEDYRETGRGRNPTGIGFNSLSPGLSQIPTHLHSSDWITDRALEFLDLRERDQPFCLWASYIDPHPPLVTDEPYFSMYDGIEIPPAQVGAWSEDETCPVDIRAKQISSKVADIPPHILNKSKGVYYGMITKLDYQLGRLIGKLMKDNDWDNTLVVYASDHGEMLGDHNLSCKSNFLEAAARVPFIVKPPASDNAPNSVRCDSLVQLADLLPTFCDYAGCNDPADVDGKSLRPIIEGKADKVREYLHGQIGNHHMYHDGRYKYLYFADDGSELCFDTENDRDDLCPLDETRAAEMRDKLVLHLASEDHNHICDGKLKNDEQEIDEMKLLAQNTEGLVPVAAFDSLKGDLLWLN